MECPLSDKHTVLATDDRHQSKDTALGPKDLSKVELGKCLLQQDVLEQTKRTVGDITKF